MNNFVKLSVLLTLLLEDDVLPAHGSPRSNT